MNKYISPVSTIQASSSLKQTILRTSTITHPMHKKWTVVYIIGLVIGLFSLIGIPVQAQQASLICTSTLISPELRDTRINTSSIESSADGQIVYLVSEVESETSTLMHVSSDDTISEVGELNKNMLGVYGSPRWNVDIEGGNAVFTSYLNDDYSVPTTIMLMDMNTAEITTLMGGVTEYDFGRDASLIWWGSNEVDDPSADFGFYLYDPVTQITKAINVETVANSQAYRANLVRTLPDRDILFTVTRFLEDTTSISYYRGNPENGMSLLLHSDNIDFSISHLPRTTIILDNSIAYIDSSGEYMEIDFDGNRTNTISLLESGFYNNLYTTPTGILFTYVNVDNPRIQGLYHVSRAGVLSELIPTDVNTSDLLSNGLLSNIEVITASNGDTTLWFNIKDHIDYNGGTLYVYNLPNDDTIAMTEPAMIVHDIGDFYSSPTGDYVIANRGQIALVIDTLNFEQTETSTEYYQNAVFFDDAQAHVVTQGRLQFVDTERNIIYYSTPMPPEEGEDFVLYATTYDSDETVRVSHIDANVPFSFHSYSFRLAADGSVIYIGNTWQSLYRARCNFIQA